MDFKDNSWRGHMTCKAAWKLGHITQEEFRAWRKEMKERQKKEASGMARFEKSESEVGNLLASLDNLPMKDVDGRLKVYGDIIVLQGRMIDGLQKQVEALKPKPLLVESVKR